MFLISRLLRGNVIVKSRIMLNSTSSSTPSSQANPASEEEYFMDMNKFIDSIGIDVRSTNKGQSFAKMLRESKLMQLGDINGRLVVGQIVHRMQDDIYIDFGLKFNAVCKVPTVNPENYRIGSQVLIRLHDAELSEKFLGSKKDLTLLEADATLISLLRSRKPTAKTIEQAKTADKQSSVASNSF